MSTKILIPIYYAYNILCIVYTGWVLGFDHKLSSDIDRHKKSWLGSMKTHRMCTVYMNIWNVGLLTDMKPLHISMIVLGQSVLICSNLFSVIVQSVLI